jgi:putative membrane protein
LICVNAGHAPRALDDPENSGQRQTERSMRKSLVLTTAAGLAALVSNAAALAQPYGPGAMGEGYRDGYGMMGGYGFGPGPIGLIFIAIILIGIIVGVVWLVRSLAAPHGHHLAPKRSAGLDVLEERYARGEVPREEYLQKKKDILG